LHASSLEAAGFFLRVDPTVTPTMFRGAVTSEAEIALLRRIDHVVRLGHVRRSKSTRLNPVGGLGTYRDDPRVVESRERIKQYALPAAMNIQKLVGASTASSTS
jgi:hypothetical protein